MGFLLSFISQVYDGVQWQVNGRQHLHCVKLQGLGKCFNIQTFKPQLYGEVHWRDIR